MENIQLTKYLETLGNNLCNTKKKLLTISRSVDDNVTMWLTWYLVTQLHTCSNKNSQNWSSKYHHNIVRPGNRLEWPLLYSVDHWPPVWAGVLPITHMWVSDTGYNTEIALNISFHNNNTDPFHPTLPQQYSKTHISTKQTEFFSQNIHQQDFI